MATSNKNAPKPEGESTVRQAEPGEYPKMLYHKGSLKDTKVVHSVQEEDALGEDWIDRPAEAPSA